MKLNLAIMLLGLTSLYGQVINAGGSNDNYFTPAQGCTLTTSCTFTDSTVVPATLRYSNTTSLNYDIPASNGPGILELGFWEPSATKIGQRVFQVSVNGTNIAQVDVYKQSGGQKHYWIMPPINVSPTDGFVHLALTQIAGKPMVATINYVSLPQAPPPALTGTFNCTSGINVSIANGLVINAACLAAQQPVTQPAPTPTAAMSACPSIVANTINSTFSANVQVYRADISTSALISCKPGTDLVTLVTDPNNLNTPVGTFVPWQTVTAAVAQAPNMDHYQLAIDMHQQTPILITCPNPFPLSGCIEGYSGWLPLGTVRKAKF